MPVVPFLSPTHNCRRTARSLGDIHSNEQHWIAAIEAYRQALQATEILYEASLFLNSQELELIEADNLFRRAAYAEAQVGNLKAAIVTIERGRARGLSENLERDRSDLSQLQQTHPELVTEYQEIASQLHNLESQQRERMTSAERNSVTPEELRDQAQQSRQALIAIIEQIRQVKGYEDFLAQLDFTDIQKAVYLNVPLVYLISSPLGGLAIVVTQTDIVNLWLDALNETSLTDLLFGTWFNAYNQSQTNHQGWLDAIDQVAHQLWQLLMAPLIDHLKQHNFQQATLIPTGYLSLLPLHAAWVDDSTKPTGRRYALDEICFTYAPNARSINAAQEIAQRIGTDSILAIDNPLKDLRNSSREVTAAVANFHQSQILKHEQATIEAVMNALSHCNILHLSCHGTADLREPLNSGLSMSNGLLTLRDLLNLRLSEQGGIRLAVLSACETGLTGIDLPDEAISLPTGLLQAGVAGVVASLWSVSDLSTMLLLVRFYDLWRKEGLAPAVALQRAQQWLRDSTEAELADYFGWLPRSPEARTYAHPFHWAAFSYTGV